MRRARYLFLGVLLASLAAGGWMYAQEPPVDDPAPTDVQPDDSGDGVDAPTAEEPAGEDPTGEDPDGDLGADGDGTETVLYGAVKGLTTALDASGNRSENAVEVLTGNLERAMQRQGMTPDPEPPSGGEAGDTVDAEAVDAATFDRPSHPVKADRPEKPERFERAARPERPERPERPGRPDRP